jgi:reactive intermediate/imine deaminase
MVSMSLKRISTSDAPAPSGGYSQGVVAGGLLHLAGQGPYDPAGTLVGRDSVEAQVRQVLDNLDAVARAAGASLHDAVRVGAYLSDLRLFDEFDAAYRAWFGDLLPARTTVQTELLDFHVEADAIVWLGS